MPVRLDARGGGGGPPCMRCFENIAPLVSLAYAFYIVNAMTPPGKKGFLSVLSNEGKSWQRPLRRIWRERSLLQTFAHACFAVRKRSASRGTPTQTRFFFFNTLWKREKFAWAGRREIKKTEGQGEAAIGPAAKGRASPLPPRFTPSPHAPVSSPPLSLPLSSPLACPGSCFPLLRPGLPRPAWPWSAVRR